MPKRTQDPDGPSNEADLFTAAVSDVKPLHHKQADIKHSRPASAAQPPREDVDDLVESGEVLQFLRSGIQTASLQNLRRGHFPVEATLDLHGFTSDEADIKLHQFIQQAQARGRRAVRIIHGKGFGSAGQPVLKAKVNKWLREFPAVLAFCSAGPRQGGTGATDVLLRK